MDRQIAEYFIKEASEVFNFVIDEYSFDPPKIEIDDKIHFVFVTFMGKNLAIECIFDERESDISCKIARVFNGEKTTHYAIDENNVRVRESLVSLLRRHGVKERLFRHVGKLELHERIKVTLTDFALMLRKYGQEILNDSSEVFIPK